MGNAKMMYCNGGFRAPWALPRWTRMAAILGLVTALSGCSILSGAGPYSSSIRNVPTENPPYELIDLTATTIAPYVRPPEPVLTATTSDMSIPDVKLVPGDVLRVMIS